MAFVTIFLIEVLIALFLHDAFIRPFVGDVLVVVLLYCFIRSFFKLSIKNAIIAVLIFAFAVEFAQYFDLVEKLGLEHNRMARIVIGSTFDLLDLLAYLTGGILILLGEQFIRK